METRQSTDDEVIFFLFSIQFSRS